MERRRWHTADVGNVEDGEGNVELVSGEMEVGGETVDASIADVGPVDERQEPQAEKPRNNVTVEFAGDTVVEVGIPVEVILQDRNIRECKNNTSAKEANVPMSS